MDEQSLSFRLLAILFPIFGIIAAGYFYGRKHKPEMAVANRLNMDVFVPALVFAAMAGKSIDLGAYAPLALGGFIVLAVCGLLAWGEEALPAAVILFMVENTLHFSFGARLLDPTTRLLTLWRIPVLFAAIAGLTVALVKIPIWQPAVIAIKMLGDVSVPLLLFSLGVRMTDVSFSEWKVAVGSAVLRPLAGMAVAYGAIAVLGLQGRDAAMLLVFGALPPAVLNFLFAERYKQEPQRVASIVLIGNLAALVFLPLALALVL